MCNRLTSEASHHQCNVYCVAAGKHAWNALLKESAGMSRAPLSVFTPNAWLLRLKKRESTFLVHLCSSVVDMGKTHSKTDGELDAVYAYG